MLLVYQTLFAIRIHPPAVFGRVYCSPTTAPFTAGTQQTHTKNIHSVFILFYFIIAVIVRVPVTCVIQSECLKRHSYTEARHRDDTRVANNATSGTDHRTASAGT